MSEVDFDIANTSISIIYDIFQLYISSVHVFQHVSDYQGIHFNCETVDSLLHTSIRTEPVHYFKISQLIIMGEF